ncbi:hypothetical protein [Lysobacter capsici]|uniref:hypothetical protein n=1 Tax=Lysobacter capsici TaxID=435897 RepID=UPI0007164300|nr:hypothetical protein [Lysobacter capsici]
MSEISEETARTLIEAVRDLTVAVTGLTGVLLEDRDAELAEQPGVIVEPVAAYMDGSTMTG